MTIMHRHLHATNREAGMSLIELMIAMTLGILIVAGLGTLFVQNKQSFRQDEMVARMQEDARFALNAIVDDIEMIGFWADVHTPDSVGIHADLTINAAADCSGTTPWIYVAAQPVVVYDDSATGIAGTFDCIAAADQQANSDAIAINRTLGDAIDLTLPGATLEGNVVYMKSNGAGGLLMTSAMTDVSISGTVKYWQYVPSMYYVRDYANVEGDGIPTLCVFELSEGVATPEMVETCLAQGVESLQIEYGIDTDVDGVANIYTSTPSNAQLQTQLVSVRIHLLMRAVDADPGYTNNKTYNIGDLANYAPADNFYRRVYTTTVLVRNTRNLRCVNIGC